MAEPVLPPRPVGPVPPKPPAPESPADHASAASQTERNTDGQSPESGTPADSERAPAEPDAPLNLGEVPREDAGEPDAAPSPSLTGLLHAWGISGERVLLAALLVGAALARLVGLGFYEPNVSTIEVVHLAALESLGTERGPSLFGSTPAGASGLALMLADPLRALRAEPELAARVYVALGSIALVGLFYGLCRRRHSPLTSLAAAALLAFSPWSIYFGRNLELNAFVAAWAVGAAWLLQRAMAGGGPRVWLFAGGAATAGLYWHPSAMWLLPALAVPIVWSAVERPSQRGRLLVALGAFVLAGLVVAGPRLPGLIAGPDSTTAVLYAEGAAAEPPAGIRLRIQQTIRAFFLLDPTANGDPRYLPPSRAPLDALTGVLLLGSIGLAVWQLPSRLMSLSLLLIPIFGSQLASPRAPSVADAVVALPGLYLLVADGIGGLLRIAPFPPVARAFVLVAIPVYALSGWQTYAAWVQTSPSAQARQPALDYDEVDPWLATQRERLLAGQPALSARAWREEHPRLATGSRTARRPRDAGPAAGASVLSQLGLRQSSVIAGQGGAQAPRGLGAAPNGDVFVADGNGRLSRLDLERGAMTATEIRPPLLEQVSDLAVDREGFIYLADAERSLLVKLNASGGVVTTLGADWGMFRPRGLAVGPDGRLYVADTGRNRIVVAGVDGRMQRSIAPPTSTPFEQPTDVAVDTSGRIYVALPEMGRLSVLDDGGQQLGGWQIPKGNTVDAPKLAVVADGAVAVTDPVQNKVRLVDADGRELAAADVPGRPYGVATTDGRLFVGDAAGGRVVVFALNAQ